jgi:pimeloyl-ACP methyl ester carboxylesterase
MTRFSRSRHHLTARLRLLLPAALLATGLGAALPAMPALAGSAAPGTTAAGVKQYTGTFPDGSTYLIQVPSKWNGTLFLYSHGYTIPGSSNPAMDASDSVTGGWLLSHGYALAGSSYATTGWAVASALTDQMKTLKTFGTLVGKPGRTIAWGDSLGGMITAGLVQRYPSSFTAAVPMCGVLSGAVATWNTALDAEFAFQQLIDPSVQVVNITDPGTNLISALNAAGKAQKTAAGRARLALSAALADTPGWFTPLSPEPSATDYLAQEQNQYLWDTEVTFPFAFDLRAQMESLAGGNPSWNTGVNYFWDLLKSSDLSEVLALYHKAGLNLDTDLAKLQSATRIKVDPAARHYLADNITYNGKLSVPVLTMHTTGDGLVVPENEQAYNAAVAKAGDSALLQQVFVSRAGHCAFTPAENITALRTIVQRVDTGSWNQGNLTPATMNAEAAALGSTYNEYGGTATDPAFTSYIPDQYLRPWTKP